MVGRFQPGFDQQGKRFRAGGSQEGARLFRVRAGIRVKDAGSGEQGLQNGISAAQGRSASVLTGMPERRAASSTVA